jgi:hypothetical protein
MIVVIILWTETNAQLGDILTLSFLVFLGYKEKRSQYKIIEVKLNTCISQFEYLVSVWIHDFILFNNSYFSLRKSRNYYQIPKN